MKATRQLWDKEVSGLCTFGDGASVLHSSFSRYVTHSTAGTLALLSCWLEEFQSCAGTTNCLNSTSAH